LKLICCFLILATSIYSPAQGGWKRNLLPVGSPANVTFNTFQTPGGQYIVSGLTGQVVGSTFNNQLTLIGFNETGPITWRKNYGSKKFEYLNGFQSGASCYVNTSHLYQVVPVRDSLNVEYSAFIKFDFNGDTLWQRTFKSTSGSIYLYSLTQTKDNGFILLGELQELNGRPLIIIKTNASGTELWRKELHKSIPDIQYSGHVIEDTLSKKLIAVGSQEIGNAQSFTTYGNITILDSLANILKRTTFNNAGAGGFGHLTKLKDGNFVTGGAYNTGGVDRESFLVKFDILGTLIWKRNYEKPAKYYNNIFFTSELNNGNILTLGTIDTMQDYLLSEEVHANIRIVDPSGELLFTKYIGSCKSSLTSERPTSLRRTADGGFIITTWFWNNSTSPFGIIKIDSTGCDTVEAYCKLMKEVGIDEYFTKGGAIRIYPNPANSFVNIACETDGDFYIRDAFGRQVMSGTITIGNKSIDVSHLVPGIYFLSFTGSLDPRYHINCKLIIVH
jgi:hypothetical protein